MADRPRIDDLHEEQKEVVQITGQTLHGAGVTSPQSEISSMQNAEAQVLAAALGAKGTMAKMGLNQQGADVKGMPHSFNAVGRDPLVETHPSPASAPDSAPDQK